jgi:tetratricopeptide (TPR) repeat protein
MSPEQAEMSALGIDTRSDIYSLGVLLYELLTGGTPLSHKRLKEAAHAEVLRMIQEEEPPKPSTRLSDSGEELASISAKRHTEPAKLTKLVRGDLDWIVMKCLEKDRNRRYETANGFAMDVQRYLADEPVQACPPSAGYRLRKFVRRNRGPVLAAGLVLLAVIAGVIATSIATARLWREQAQTRLAFDNAQTNLDLALEALDEIYIDEAEGHPKIREGLPRDLLQKGLEFYEKFVRENARNERLIVLMGKAYQRAGLIDRALGKEARAVESFERAVSAYDRALQVDPLSAPAHRHLSYALRELGRLDEALAAIDRAIVIEPRDAAAHDGRGSALRSLQCFEEALTAYERASELGPRSSVVHTNRGTVLCDHLGRPAEALVAFDRALELEPRDLRARHNRGVALRELGRFDEALAASDATIAFAPGAPGSYSDRAAALLNLRRFEEALAACDVALELDPRHIRAHTNRAEALEDLGRIEEALEAYDRAIAIDERDVTALHNRGNVLHALGRFEEALEALDRTVAIDPRRGPAYASRAAVLAAQGKIEAAIEDCTKAIRLGPDGAEPHCNLGQLLMRQGRFQEAVPCLRRGHELGSKRAEWTFPSAKWLEAAERMADRMGSMLSGTSLPADVFERIGLARALHAMARNAESARMYVEAFADDGVLAEDLAQCHRYNAACSAVLAAAHGEFDAAEWRGRALGWLRADVEARERTGIGLAATLSHWKKEPDLACVRDRLDDLPEPERAAWRGLWADVDFALARALPAVK